MAGSVDVFDEKRAGEYLGGNWPISISTMRRWRHDGTGPIYIKMQRFVRYRKRDLDQYLLGSVRESTKENHG